MDSNVSLRVPHGRRRYLPGPGQNVSHGGSARINFRPLGPHTELLFLYGNILWPAELLFVIS